MYTLEGVSNNSNFITAYEESQNRDSHFLICNVFFVSKGTVLFISVGMAARVAKK